VTDGSIGKVGLRAIWGCDRWGGLCAEKASVAWLRRMDLTGGWEGEAERASSGVVCVPPRHGVRDLEREGEVRGGLLVSCGGRNERFQGACWFSRGSKLKPLLPPFRYVFLSVSVSGDEEKRLCFGRCRASPA
jgi:hypothetical protein